MLLVLPVQCLLCQTFHVCQNSNVNRRASNLLSGKGEPSAGSCVSSSSSSHCGCPTWAGWCGNIGFDVCAPGMETVHASQGDGAMHAVLLNPSLSSYHALCADIGPEGLCSNHSTHQGEGGHNGVSNRVLKIGVMEGAGLGTWPTQQWCLLHSLSLFIYCLGTKHSGLIYIWMDWWRWTTLVDLEVYDCNWKPITSISCVSFLNAIKFICVGKEKSNEKHLSTGMKSIA